LRARCPRRHRCRRRSSGTAALTQITLYGEYRALAAKSATTTVAGALLVQTGARASRAEQLGWSLGAAAVTVAALDLALIPLDDFDHTGGEDAP